MAMSHSPWGHGAPAGDASKRIIVNTNPSVAAADVTSGVFGSGQTQGNLNYTFPAGISVNGATPAASTGLVALGALSKGIDAEISGTSAYNYGLIGSAYGAGSTN